MSLLGDVTRGLADVATFGTNELAGNPAGKLADQIVNPTDPNQAANAYNAQQAQLAQQQIQLEKDFAQNGITWRVADAARNGISPLAALGASEPSFNPVTQAFSPPVSTPSLSTTLLQAGASEFGQGVARSLLSTQSSDARKASALDLAYKAKQNDLLDVQIANARFELANHAIGPSVPLAFHDVLNLDGSTSTVPSQGGQFFGPALWSIHNKLIPAMQGDGLNWNNPKSQDFEQN